jgi:hypothetical protein
MNEHATAFNGDAISQVDREFLASLSNHPLARHPLYSVPPPPRPDYNGCITIVEKQTAQELCFPAALDWLLVNYAYYTGAFMGKGGIISLVDGEMCAIASLRSFMQPYMIVEEGPRGGLKMISVVNEWMRHPQRAQIDKIQTRPDQPRPTFVEDGLTVFNHYWPPAHPTEGGDVAPFEAFFENLVPDATERDWLWHWIAHKARRPWLPMIAVIMVAEKFGTGRGTLFEILALLFGKSYVQPCSFGELTGASASARFNARLADILIAVVNEAVDEEGHQQSRRRLAYEALKNTIDPAPKALRRFEAKGQHAFAQLSAMSVIIATNHRDVVKLPRDDRRFCVITGGDRMAIADVEAIRAWMAVPENIGALYRALLAAPAVPTMRFNPFDDPPPFDGRLDMISMGETRLEDAYWAAMDALDGYPLFTLTQALRLIGCFGNFAAGAWSDKARHAVSKNAYRVRKRGEPNNRITYRKKQEIIYARTVEDQQRWHGADKEMIVAALDRTEVHVVRLNSLGVTDFAGLARAAEGGDVQEDDDYDGGEDAEG